MSLDLSQFHAVFFEESFEAVTAIESGLLDIQIDNVDPEMINTIFRAAHSIKGGSATFGFQQVASYTHVMETCWTKSGMASGPCHRISSMSCFSPSMRCENC